MKQNWIGLLDCNNFFVSCERLFRPDLEGKPVAVLSSNDGCIVARSQEIKDIGIPMGVPYFQIKDILKTNEVTLFSGNHRLYKTLSKRVFAEMKSLISDIEQYSIDEAFFYFEGTEEEVEGMARRLKSEIERIVGIPVSLGVSKTKTLAKVAAKKAKQKNGFSILSDSDLQAEMKSLPVGSVWGIGGRLSRRLSDDGIKTVENLLNTDPAVLKSKYGVVGQRLCDELRGQPVLGRSSRESKQSIMSSRSFGESTQRRDTVLEAVLFHVEQIAYELRQSACVCKEIVVFIAPSRHGDFALHNRSGVRVLGMPTANTRELVQAATALVDELFVENVPYKKAGVRVSGIQPMAIAQLSLFTEQAPQKEDKLQTALDEISRRYSTGRVHQGFFEGKRSYSAKSGLRSPDYMSDWRGLVKVKA